MTPQEPRPLGATPATGELLLPGEQQGLLNAFLNQRAADGSSLDEASVEAAFASVLRWAGAGLVRVLLVREVIEHGRGISVLPDGRVVVDALVAERAVARRATFIGISSLATIDTEPNIPRGPVSG